MSDTEWIETVRDHVVVQLKDSSQPSGRQGAVEVTATERATPEEADHAADMALRAYRRAKDGLEPKEESAG